ncbi:MAG: DNA recombination protein RmuC [Eubacterium sp.]|nr:DNA recombination protein RmuC [Eubacterium sp.]
MDIFIIALLLVLIVLVITAIVLISRNKPVIDYSVTNNSLALLDQKLDINSKQSGEAFRSISEQMHGLTEKNYEQMLKINESLNENAERQTKRISESILLMQNSNEQKLEEMRKTVDEKLTDTLNQRLNASFKTVSEQLQNVYKSLGEMKELSSGVTDKVADLNKVLTNVKARGTWAEVQLGNILDETIPGMYDTNVKTNPKYNGQVEFAIRIPNQEDDGITYLPVDSKFPMEDYVRLVEASEAGNAELVEQSRKALERRVRDEARLVRQYISTPETTPFAILYLATEGLYAEITSSKNGVAEKLQAEGVMVAGPSTITALLSSLAMGFRTMAINKKANEVWKVLGAAKTQYDKFGDLLQKAKKKVEEAGRVLDEADHRNDIIQKNLRKVEILDNKDAQSILGIEE